MSAIPEVLQTLASAVIITDRKKAEIGQAKTVKVRLRVPINVAVPADGGFAPLVQGLSPVEGFRSVIGAYLNLQGGAARNTQVVVRPKSPAADFPVSDNAVGSYTLFGIMYLEQDDILGVLVAAAADATVLVGWITLEDEVVVQ